MTDSTQAPECCQDTTDSSISADQAIAIIQQQIKPVTAQQSAPIRHALGRILAEDIISPISVPSHINSAMDGYAVAGDELPSAGIKQLTVVGSSFAGSPFKGKLGAGECIRIMTGAKMPEQCDTVVMQELAERTDDVIQIDGRTKSGSNVRQAGEDIMVGTSILKAGKQIAPADLGLLASLGIAEVPVIRKVRVAYFSSGDEIKSIGQPLGEGDIYDSNRYTLFGMLSDLGVDIIDMGVIADNEEAINQALTGASEEADLVLTSGGVSVGEADYIAAAMDTLAKPYFRKVAIKPGRPLTFAGIGGAYFFGLPGNPVAVMTTFLQFARPAIKRLQGTAGSILPLITARASSALRKLPGRTEFQRGILTVADDGEMTVCTTGKQGSGVLSSMSHGNCFIVLDETTTDVEEGDWVTIQPFSLLRS